MGSLLVALGSLTASVLLVSALVLVTGALLSGRPRRSVALGTASLLVVGAVGVATVTAVLIVVGLQLRVLGHHFPFDLVVSDTYRGPLVLETCSDRPATPVPKVIEVPDNGIVELGPGYVYDYTDYEVDVRRRDGTPLVGTSSTYAGGGGAPCEYLVLVVAESDPWLIHHSIREPSELVAEARARGISYAEAASASP